MDEAYAKTIERTWAYIVAIGMLFVLGTAISLLDDIDGIRKDRFQLAASQAGLVSRTIFAARQWTMGNDGMSAPDAATPRRNASPAMNNRSTRMTVGGRNVEADHVSITKFIGMILKPDGFHIRIVGRKALLPENLPENDWERISLGKFETGSIEEYALTGIPENRVFQYMKPLKVDAGCIRCHGQQGHNIGEVLGGLVVSFPYGPFEQSARRSIRREIIAHLLALGVALGILFFLGRRIVGLTRNLQETQRKVRTLEGILPMCMNCKKILKEGTPASDPAAWIPVAEYIRDRSEAEVSHGICPECMEKLYGPGGSLTER